MTYLPDVNLWIALAVIEHVHHEAAQRWLEETSAETIAFCRITQMGFLRLLTNDRVMSADVLSADGAWRLMERIRKLNRVVFAAEPAGLEQRWRDVTAVYKSGSNFWTDGYLSAFVQLAGYTLVTFDKGFAQHKRVSVRILR